MKKLFLVLICLILFTPSAHSAITWTKSWSSGDDGSPFSGSDIEDIQSDISSQVPTLAGDNTYTGSNTYSGAITFTGSVTGVAAAKDAITRGFEPVYGSVEQVIVNVGTLYHGTTQVNKTSNVHLDVTTASDYVTGVSEQAISTWLYIYSNSTGSIKFDDNAPDKSDSAGDTEGKFIYYYYAAGSTYWRCIGATYLNATGAGEVSKFYAPDGKMYMWDVPISVTSTASPGAWSGETSCAAAMPAISTMGIFGLYTFDGADSVIGLWIRPSGSTWSVDEENGIYETEPASGDYGMSSQRWCATDNSQQIQYYQHANDDNVEIDIEGFMVNIR